MISPVNMLKILFCFVDKARWASKKVIALVLSVWERGSQFVTGSVSALWCSTKEHISVNPTELPRGHNPFDWVAVATLWHSKAWVGWPYATTSCTFQMCPPSTRSWKNWIYVYSWFFSYCVSKYFILTSDTFCLCFSSSCSKATSKCPKYSEIW